jgi:hypothetical protein
MNYRADARAVAARYLPSAESSASSDNQAAAQRAVPLRAQHLSLRDIGGGLLGEGL